MAKRAKCPVGQEPRWGETETPERRGSRIVSFVALNSIQAARVLKKDIIAEISSLKLFPEKTPFLEGEFIPFNKYHKLVVRRNYLVIYQIKDDTVLVDYVIDCRQDYEWLIR